MNLVKRSLMAAAAAFVLTAGMAQAALVDYSTTGSFNGGAYLPLTTISSGSTTLSFIGTTAAGSGVNTPTYGSLGTFQLSSSNPGPSGDVLSGNFSLRITQTTPGPTVSGDLMATIGGRVYATSSTGIVEFTTTHVTLNGITYDVANADFGLTGRVALVAPNTNLGFTTVQASITGGQVPEPSTYALLGGGLVSLIGFARRRSRS